MKKTLKPDVTITLEPGRVERLTEAVARAIAGVGRGAAVLLVDPDAWCQEVELSVKRIQGTSQETLSRLIAYESEAFSGMSPAKTAIVFHRETIRGDVAVYRVLEIPLAELVEVQKVVGAVGAKLVGVTHPDLQATGERIEPPPAPVSPMTYVWRATLVAATVVAICAAVQLFVNRETLRLRDDLATLERLRGECRALESRAATDRQVAREMRRKLESEVRDQLRVLRARRSFTRILEALSATCPEGGMIKRISSEGDFTLAIEGVTVSSADSELFLKRLGEQLKPGGFDVATLTLDAMNQLPGGGPWSFKCRIQPVPGEVQP